MLDIGLITHLYESPENKVLVSSDGYFIYRNTLDEILHIRIFFGKKMKFFAMPVYKKETFVI